MYILRFQADFATSHHAGDNDLSTSHANLTIKGAGMVRSHLGNDQRLAREVI